MYKLKFLIKNFMIVLTVTVQVFLSPGVAIAEEITPDADPIGSSATQQIEPVEPTPVVEPIQTNSSPTIVTESGPSSTTIVSEPSQGPTTPTGPQVITGPTTPTGAASSTYKFNEETGLWENDQYTWDPVTKQTKPKTPQTYSYNPSTGMWDTTEWYYKPETGKYEPNTLSVAQNPLAPASNSIIGTGPNSNNNINLNGTTNGTFDLFFDARVSNKIGQLSVSGNANVQGNTFGGSATSGDAETLLNLLNLLQSSWGELGSQDIATFIANINGDLVGDLYIDPSNMASSGNSNIDVNVSNNSEIDNEVDSVAQSGDANVSNNTTGGSALSGNARAIVNLINMINSAITANKSFVGVLNINGNLEGDILLSEGLLQLILASTGPGSNNTINSNDNDSLDVSIDTNRSIINDVSVEASSGNALVENNTNAGSAKSGSADTNILLLNLTGHHVVAKNAMLVFVNVLGSWLGLILDAPAGSNAVAVTGPGSTNTINISDNDNTTVNYTENSRINNDIDVSAASGDAIVAGNTNAGGATAGNANVGVNIVNMIDSTFDISDWFGILFINVFGTWHGSFGVDTPYGNKVAESSNSSAAGVGSSSNTNTNQNGVGFANNPGVFNFLPSANRYTGTTAGSSNQVAAAVSANENNNTPGSVSLSNNDTSNASTALEARPNWTWTIAGMSVAFSLLGFERFLTLRKRII